MDELIQQETADRRYPTGLLGLFAAFGFLLGGDGADHVCDHGQLIPARRAMKVDALVALSYE